MGDPATVFNDGRLQYLFWESGESPIRWDPISHLYIHCAASLGIVCNSAQPGKPFAGAEHQYGDENLFSPYDPANLFNSGRCGGFLSGFSGVDRNDDLLQDHTYCLYLDITFISAVDAGHRPGSGVVAFSVECALP